MCHVRLFFFFSTITSHCSSKPSKHCLGRNICQRTWPSSAESVAKGTDRFPSGWEDRSQRVLGKRYLFSPHELDIQLSSPPVVLNVWVMNLCRFQTCFYSWRSAGGPSMCHYGFFDTTRVSFASSKWKIPTSYKASLATVIIPRYVLYNKRKFYDKGDLNDIWQLQIAHLRKEINPPLHKRCLDVSIHVASWLMWCKPQSVFVSNGCIFFLLEFSRRLWLLQESFKLFHVSVD